MHYRRVASASSPTTPARSYHVSYRDPRRYTYQLSVTVPSSIHRWLVWELGDPGIVKLWITGKPSAPITLSVRNTTPARMAPVFDGGPGGVSVALIYPITAALVRHREALFGPNVGTVRPRFIAIGFTFSSQSYGIGSFKPVYAGIGQTLSIPPTLLATYLPYVAGGVRIDERDKRTLSSTFAHLPSYIAITVGRGGLGTYSGDEPGLISNCVFSGITPIPLLAMFTTGGTRLSCGAAKEVHDQRGCPDRCRSSVAALSA